MIENEGEEGQEVVEQPAETKEEAFARGVEEARIAEGGEPAKVEEPVDNAGDTKDDKKDAAETQTPEEKAEADRKAALESEIKELGLKEKKAERFRTLESGYREAQQLKREIEPLREKAQQLDQFNAIMKDTRATPDQISTMFSLVKRSNSGDVTQMRSALKDVVAYAQELAKAVGEPIAASSPVNDHPDLLERISAGDLSEDAAIEIIRARATEARVRDTTNAQRAQEQAQAEAQRSHEAAIGQLNELGAQLNTTDPHYDYKLKQMIDSGTVAIIKRLPPNEWAGAFKEAYAILKDPPPKPKPAAMPLRPTGSGAAVMKAEPKSATDGFMHGYELAREQGL